jgi:NAD-dependent deacetylase
MNQILIFTGAGLSAESGISTFRDNVDGLWTKYDPEMVANLRNFAANRSEVFKFYNERRIELPTLKPNAAHEGIAALQKKYGKDVVKVYTQNIDDFLERAGVEDVVHVHGKFTDMHCLACTHTWDIGHTHFGEDEPCPSCGDIDHVKPGVIFFYENAPEYPEMYRTFKNSRQDIIVVIGTSGEVISLDYICGNRYSTNKSFTILNNKDHDKYGQIDYKNFDVCIFKPATEGIEKILVTVEHEYEKKLQAVPKREVDHRVLNT